MKKLAVHTFTNENDLTFDKITYSNFKYGGFSETIEFAKALSEKLYQYIIDNNLLGKEIVATGAPYNQVPVASSALCEYSILSLNEDLIKHNHSPVKIIKVSREHSYHDDYGNMSTAERDRAICGETFHADEHELEGKFVIFIDDIRISGAHERRMQKMVDSMSVKFDYMYAYYAMLDNNECSPKIEGMLNHASIKKDGSTITEFLIERLSLIKEPIILNTRASKFLLSLSEELFVNNVLPVLDIATMMLLYKYAIGNTYHTHELYITNFNHLKELVEVHIINQENNTFDTIESFLI